MKRYRFITIQQNLDELFEGKPVYRVYTNKDHAQLATISWYKPWKQYVFSSQEGCVFNNSRLKNILDFLENVIAP